MRGQQEEGGISGTADGRETRMCAGVRLHVLVGGGAVVGGMWREG